jgi:hypothetical protein
MSGWAKINYTVIDRIPELGKPAVIMYLVLARHADSQGRCWPALRRLSEMAGMRRNSVCDAVAALEKASLLVVDRTDGRSNTYTLLPLSGGNETATGSEGTGNETATGTGNETATGSGNETATRTRTREQDPKNKSGSKKSRPSFDPLAVDLPFQSPEFKTAWSDFAESRRASKNPLTAAAATRILKKLSAWGEPAAVEALDTSIENGWRGVFAPKSNGKAGSNGQPHTCKVLTVEEYRETWNPYGGNGHEH